jgi:hypothetical protein
LASATGEKWLGTVLTGFGSSTWASSSNSIVSIGMTLSEPNILTPSITSATNGSDTSGGAKANCGLLAPSLTSVTMPKKRRLRPSTTT